MKIGFLFGAGAEVGYGLTSGGKFALEIFRQDTTKIKDLFKDQRERIDGFTYYAANWLPDDYKKSVSSFGKTVFEAIIKDTIEHNRSKIIEKLNDFDDIAKDEERKISGVHSKTYSQVVGDILGTILKNCNMKHEISFIEYFNEGNKIFESNNVIESIYASVLDYKSLIDSNWHYLYCPKDEWAKFCKINIFLIKIIMKIRGSKCMLLLIILTYLYYIKNNILIVKCSN